VRRARLTARGWTTRSGTCRTFGVVAHPHGLRAFPLARVSASCDVQVTALAALEFFDVAAVQDQTGSPVRGQYARSGAARSQVPDAILAAPATCNTSNKRAQNVSDTYAFDVLADATGPGVPIVVLPQRPSRTPFRRSVKSLRAEGVRISPGQAAFSHPPSTDGSFVDSYP
jgi:hypothetical protein